MEPARINSFNCTRPLVLVQLYDSSVRMDDLVMQLDAMLWSLKEDILVQIILLDAKKNLGAFLGRQQAGNKRVEISAVSNMSLIEGQVGVSRSPSLFQEYSGPLVHSTIRRILTNQLYDVSMNAFQKSDAVAPGVIYVLEAGADSKLEIQRKHPWQKSFDSFIEELIVYQEDFAEQEPAFEEFKCLPESIATLATVDELVTLVQAMQRQAVDECDMDGPASPSKAAAPVNRGLAHVLSSDEHRLVIKPAVDRFNKQYRSQYKTEFVAIEQSLDTSVSSAGKAIAPKEVFGQFKTIKNLVQGIIQSSKELKAQRKLSPEEYSVHVLKFMVDNNQFRSECFRHALAEGHVRDYESLCYHFDFKPYQEGQRPPASVYQNEVVQENFEVDEPRVEEVKRSIPSIETSLDEALRAYANLTMCKLILDQVALQGIQKVQKLDNQIQHFARQSINQSKGQDLTSEQRALLTDYSKKCVKPTLVEYISVTILSHLIERKVMAPDRQAAAVSAKQQNVPSAKLVWTDNLEDFRRQIQGRQRPKGDFQRRWQLTHMILDEQLVGNLVATKMNDAFTKLAKVQVGNQGRKRLNMFTLNQLNQTMKEPDTDKMSLNTTLQLDRALEDVGGGNSIFEHAIFPEEPVKTKEKVADNPELQKVLEQWSDDDM